MAPPDPSSSPTVAAPARRRRLGLALLLALAFFLGALEVVSRAVAQRPLPIRFSQDIDVLMGVGQEGFARILQPDSDRFWRLAPDVLLPETAGRYGGRVSNAQGLREERVIPQDRRAGEFRVLFVGSSPTYGSGVLREETFVEVAQARLAERYPGETVECINAGVPGYSLFQGWRYLATEGRLLHPDLIVVQFGASGIQGWDGKGDFEHWREERAARPPGVLARSAFARLLWRKLYRPAPSAGQRVRPRLSPKEFRDLLGRVEGIARELGAGLLFVASPSRTHVMRTEGARRTPLHDILLRFAVEHGYPAVDLGSVLGPLSRRTSPAEVFLDAWHPTVLGHAAVGERIADEIARWRAAARAAEGR